MSDSNECLFDCSEKATIALMQMDLKFRLCIRIGLVNWITPLSSSSWNRTLSLGGRNRHLAPFFYQNLLISVQIFSVHFRFPITHIEKPGLEGIILHP